MFGWRHPSQSHKIIPVGVAVPISYIVSAGIYICDAPIWIESLYVTRFSWKRLFRRSTVVGAYLRDGLEHMGLINYSANELSFSIERRADNGGIGCLVYVKAKIKFVVEWDN